MHIDTISFIYWVAWISNLHETSASISMIQKQQLCCGSHGTFLPDSFMSKSSSSHSSSESMAHRGKANFLIRSTCDIWFDNYWIWKPCICNPIGYRWGWFLFFAQWRYVVPSIGNPSVLLIGLMSWNSLPCDRLHGWLDLYKHIPCTLAQSIATAA